jgi:outer membrane biosynthesis protein TonB
MVRCDTYGRDRTHLSLSAGCGAGRSPRLLVLGVLLTCILIACSGAVASASTYELRGEWSVKVTCPCSPTPLTGTMLITKMEPNGEFSGTTLTEGAFRGTVTGTLTSSDDDVSVVVVSEGPSTFTSTSAMLEPSTNTISGEGYYEGPSFQGHPPGEFTYKKIRSLQEIEKAEQEAKERAAKERELREQETKKKEQEAKEQETIKKEQEAKELEIKEREKAEKEPQEKAEREKAEKEAKEAKERAEKSSQESKPQGGGSTTQIPALLPAELAAKASSASSTGGLSFSLQNPNGYAISGQLTLTGVVAAKAGKTSHSGKTTVLGGASFTIPAHGAAVVKLKLSKSARGELSRGKKLHVTARITTNASGQTPIVKTYSLTLKASSASRQR